MHLPRMSVILIVTFLVSATCGTGNFAVFRWIAEKNPPATSLQIGLISALGNLSYFLCCRFIPRLGAKLEGRGLPVAGLLLGLIGFILLAMSRWVWITYLLWPSVMLSWCLIFVSLTGWVRYGRSGRALRSGLFLYSIAWMSAVIFGAFLGSRIYGLAGGDAGASYVYLANSGMYLACLGLLCLPSRKLDITKEEIDKDRLEHVNTNVASAFMRMGWVGNAAVMICGIILLNVFSKLATDMQLSPEVHGSLVVVYRASMLIIVGIMALSLLWHYRWWSFLVAEGLAIVGLCLIGITGAYWLFMIGFMLAGVMIGHNYYAGAYYSLTSVSSGDATGQRGRAAVNESYFAVGAIAGAVLGGLAGWYSVRLPYFLAAGAILVAFLIQMNMLRKSRSAVR